MSSVLLRVLSITTIFFLANGCARVRSQITVFHQLPTSLTGKSVAILGAGDKQDTLEFSAYRHIIEAQFHTNGLLISADSKVADYQAVLSYGVDNGKQINSSDSIPVFGQTGGGTTAYASGTINSNSGGAASYSGTSYTPPTYGITGFNNYTTTSTVYGRFLALDMYDRSASEEKGKPVQVYQASVRSEGSCSALAVVFGPMAEALFKDFPGTSGQTRKVTIALPSGVAC